MAEWAYQVKMPIARETWENHAHDLLNSSISGARGLFEQQHGYPPPAEFSIVRWGLMSELERSLDPSVNSIYAKGGVVVCGLFKVRAEQGEG